MSEAHVSCEAHSGMDNPVRTMEMETCLMLECNGGTNGTNGAFLGIGHGQLTSVLSPRSVANFKSDKSVILTFSRQQL